MPMLVPAYREPSSAQTLDRQNRAVSRNCEPSSAIEQGLSQYVCPSHKFPDGFGLLSPEIFRQRHRVVIVITECGAFSAI